MDKPDPRQVALFRSLTFDGFRKLANDPSLSPYEKIGFPDSFRAGREADIHRDILQKLPAMAASSTRILDIGCGCSDLPRIILDEAVSRDQRVTFVDSEEMLALVADSPVLEKVAGRFPDCPALVSTRAGSFDAILVYSVFHYVFAEGNAWSFLDQALALLAPGGRLLLGDIPNVSMRRRFLASAAGIAHHKAYTGRDEAPALQYDVPTPGEIDDSVVAAMVARGRAQGFHAYVVPQPASLPMANRREDLLFERP